MSCSYTRCGSVFNAMNSSKLPIDEDDVSFIFEDLYMGRSIIPPHIVPSRPQLIRWDARKPLSLENCVVFDFPEAEKHARECLGLGGGERRSPLDVWGETVQAIVDKNAINVSQYRQWVGLYL